MPIDTVLLGLLVSAFLSSTILPGTSEIALAAIVVAALRDGDAALVKGSLGMRMASVVRALDGAGGSVP